MLNRRLLRIKVMQALYGYHLCRESNAELAIKEIQEQLLQSELPEYANKAAVKEHIEKIAPQLNQYFLYDTEISTPLSKALDELVTKEKNKIVRQNQQDAQHLRKLLIQNTNLLVKEYMEVLYLLLSLADYVLVEEEEQRNKLLNPIQSPEHELKFNRNIFIQAMRDSQQLNKMFSEMNCGWSKQHTKEIYKNMLRQDEEYRKYRSLTTQTFEADKEFILHVIKHVIFKNPKINSEFESSDIFWEENKDIITTLATKTIKQYKDEKINELKIFELSQNWEEDKQFFLELFDYSIEADKQLEKIVLDRVENWDNDRLATLDKILLKLATAEMIRFSSIPIKVSINEFIEISKEYSTAKSKVFINGLLDKIAADLTADGTIKKSGRGLIDNK
ncbi:MAG: transcription antitermination factor NusB [Cytophagaceae bacterium]|nr:transcription antitermination factor NusB [Cytophagaceae bacterium]MDW8456424.1 transcription antitermination factor NusB [Cytophagaceae bacterium]